MKNITLALAFFLSLAGLNAQTSPVGVWQTIDDETNEPKSHVEIFMKNDMYYGKIVKLLPAATTDTCTDCPGDKKGKPLVGLEILWDLKPYKDYWSYGKILDPANGKVYKCSIWMEKPDQLQLRGYIGVSLLGRTQTWHRVK